MPRRVHDLFIPFLSTAEIRAEAQKWEDVATAAELDGDMDDAERCRREAANLRQLAREKAVDERSDKGGVNDA